MKRDTAALANNEFDLLIIGGGIHGCCAARDAALRGLKVALIEKGDFVSGNSSNSLKIIHGGLRYLQQADIGRMRASIEERRAMLRIAPHLVQPLACVLPTYGMGIKSRHALAAAMIVNDIISFDRNKDVDENRRIPGGKTISRDEVLRMLPGLNPEGVTGGAVWHDAQTYNTERLPLGFLISAVDEGAVVANYVEAVKLNVEKGAVKSVTVRDILDEEEFDIRARIVLSCGGKSADAILESGGIKSDKPHFLPSTAMNLVLKRPLVGEIAAGLNQRFEHKGSDGNVHKGSRVLFAAPWRGVSIVGTRHLPLGDGPHAAEVTEDKIENFLADINAAYPGAKLRREDVAWWHWGILPMLGEDPKSGDANLMRHSKIIDHAGDGAKNLISIIGVKYTTGRRVASESVDLALKKLEFGKRESLSDKKPLPGGDIESFESLIREIHDHPGDFSDAAAMHLARNYGADYTQVLTPAEEDPDLIYLLPGSDEAIAAEVVHAVREEMAMTLADVLLRRTDIGTKGKPDSEVTTTAAHLMAKELGWSVGKMEDEIRDFEAVYSVIA